MSALKLTQIGNSVGVILPKEVLAQMKLEKGDTVFVTEAANGASRSRRTTPSSRRQMDGGAPHHEESRNVLRELAK